MENSLSYISYCSGKLNEKYGKICLRLLFAPKNPENSPSRALAAGRQPQRRQAIAPRTARELPKLRRAELPRGVAVELPGATDPSFGPRKSGD